MNVKYIVALFILPIAFLSCSSGSSDEEDFPLPPEPEIPDTVVKPGNGFDVSVPQWDTDGVDNGGVAEK